MSLKFHIVHTEASCGWGGQEIRILTEAYGMLKRGHNVTIIACPDSPILNKAIELDIPTITFQFKKNSLINALRLRKVIKSISPSIINTHSSTDSWISAIARLFLNIPIIRTRHISAKVSDSFFTRWLYLKGSDMVVTTGQKLCDDLVTTLNAPTDHIISIPTGIDLFKFSKCNSITTTESRDLFNIPRNSIVIGIASTLRTWKGHRYLIEAFNKLAKNYANLHLLIVGEGPIQDLIFNQSQQSAFKNRIHMPGQQEYVENALAAMDIFALPSYANEGVPQAILQAMAMTMPVVSTNIGAIEEAVLHDQTGLIVNPKDSNSLFVALNTLIDNDEKRLHFGNRGRNHVEKHFSIDIMLDRMESIFSLNISKKY